MNETLPALSVQAVSYADCINACWRRTVKGFFEAGDLLIEAKGALPHGEFERMVAEKLDFSARTGQRLMAIARDNRLRNPTHVSLLPPHWGTLYELSCLDDSALEQRFADGTIKPDMERAGIATVVKQDRRAEREVETAAKIKALPQKKYGVILADPEWKFETWSERGMNRSAENHYSTTATEIIASRDVASIAADDSVLLLWAVPAMLRDALDVMEAWGFVYKTHAVWAKERFTKGFWFRGRHEDWLLGTRGNPVCPAEGEQFPSLLRPRDPPRADHSRKPALFRKIIETHWPNTPKIELNAADDEEWPGWDRWGAPHREAAE